MINRYNIKCKYIAYGADMLVKPDVSLLSEYGLTKKQYFVLMARMEPENNIEMLLDGYCLSNSAKKFIVIGNTANGYGKYLVNKFRSRKEIIFMGALFDQQKIKTITKFSAMYFHGHSVGGTNPSLLEAMAAEAFIAAHSNPFNKSILKDNALYFTNPPEVCALINHHENVLNETFISNNLKAVQVAFNWEKIIGQYDLFFRECYLEKRARKPVPQAQPILVEQFVETE